MKISTIINKFFQHEFETTSRTQIENTWGERIRPVAGTDKVEISTTYFYKEVFVWFDDFFQARELLEATGIKGKVINTNDLDANDLLLNNQLNNILIHEFEQEEFTFTSNQ